MKRKNTAAPLNSYERDCEKFIPQYVEATGDHNWTSLKVAAWAIKNNLWEQRTFSAVKELAKDISRAARKVTFTNESGDSVRKYHAFRLGEDQPMLWSAMEEITPDNMKYSINARREKLVNGALKAIIDAEYFNKHYNPGEPIHIDTDLTKDVNEKRQPGLYDDRPPEDGAAAGV